MARCFLIGAGTACVDLTFSPPKRPVQAGKIACQRNIHPVEEKGGPEQGNECQGNTLGIPFPGGEEHVDQYVRQKNQQPTEQHTNGQSRQHCKYSHYKGGVIIRSSGVMRSLMLKRSRADRIATCCLIVS